MVKNHCPPSTSRLCSPMARSDPITHRSGPQADSAFYRIAAIVRTLYHNTGHAFETFRSDE
jgi:hypothetical protein